ncbi:MAG TPA: aminoglycoside phosphotransferase family protein [Micromonosporaceae bacterium]
MPIEIPPSYAGQPRWWSGGQDWLAALPELVRELCDRWQLTIDGEIAHGSHALVVPVNGSLALRLAPPDDDIGRHIRALRFWDGRGTVRLIDSDVERGAMLLERLGTPLSEVPVAAAMAVLGRMMRRLAIPAPADVPSTADIVATRADLWTGEWRRLGEPFDRAILTTALASAARLSTTGSTDAVNGDLHSDQILGGEREPWLTVDPVLLRGDIAYDLGRVLWTRVDEMRDAADIVRHFEIVVAAAELDRERARDWVVFRAVDYWLWGLGVGLTEDPPRCARLLTAFHLPELLG